jgi:ABC-type amino acid transport substrate-binding protein
MKNFIKTIFFLYTIPLFALAEQGEVLDTPLSETNKTIITVATQEIGYFPFYYAEKGKIKGFSVDVLNYIEAHSKYKFEFITLPWSRAVHLVAEGNVDLILTLFKTSKREKIYHFIEPSFANEVNQLFTLSDSNFEFNGQLQQLTPYSIGTVRKYSYGEYFDGASYLNKLPALSEEVLLKLLLNESIDMLISNPLVFQQVITKKKMGSNVKAIEPYISLIPVYMALTKEREDSLEIKKTMGKLIQNLKASPNYQKLLDKYQLNFK